MIITITIYSLIIIYIIVRGLYISRKPLGKVQNRESCKDSISLSAMPFYLNQGKINLFIFFINFLLLSFISLTFLPELISNNIVYCQEEDILSINENHPDFLSPFFRGYNYEHNGLFKKLIDDAYKISNEYHFYIYHLNSSHIEIIDYLKVFQSFSQNVEDILKKQNILLENISFIKKNTYDIYKIRSMYYEISQRSMDTLILTSNAYNTIMDLYNNNDNSSNSSNSENSFSLINQENNILKDHSYSKDLLNKILNNKTNYNKYINENIGNFIERDHQVNNLNKKVSKIFNILEEVEKLSKKNYNILENSSRNISLIQEIKIPEEYKIKNFDELYNYASHKSLVFSNPSRYDNIYENIDKYHKEYYHCNEYNFKCNQNMLRERGFFLKKNDFLRDFYESEQSEENYNYFS